MRFITSLVIAAQSAFASKIIYRGDVPYSLYEASADDYKYFFPYPKPTPGNPDTDIGMNCSATLIDSTHAITAAHCFSKGSPQPPFDVVIGGADYTVVEQRSNTCYKK